MKNIDKKSIIIIAAALAAAIIIFIIVALLAGGGDGEGAETGGTVAVGGTFAEETKAETNSDEGDDAIDPENNDITLEEGAKVEAEEISPEVGRSHGIDVSKWQGKIDWAAVKASGVDFAFIRIGYRGENGQIYKDSNADYNIQQAQSAGVLVGVYFFSTAVNADEARSEAEWTVRQIEGYSISYPVVYDCEGFKLPSSRMYGVTSEQRTENALEYMRVVREAGYEPMLYAAKNDLEGSAYWLENALEGSMIWVAQYPATTYPAVDKPDYNGSFDAWQYTNKGSVSGIEGNVDMVVCYFERELATPKNAAAAPSTAAPPKTQEEMKYTDVNETVTAKELVNLRSAATTKSDVVGTLANGDTATRIGIGTNGWSKLEWNGKTVYAITSYLTTDLSTPETNVPEGDVVSGNTFTPRSDSVTAKDYVNLRSLPTTESEVVGTLKNGTFLERTAVSNKGWSRLIYNGQTVYAVTSYLTTEADAPDTDTVTGPQYDGFEPVDEQVTAKVETNLRDAPTTNGSNVVYTLKNGEYVRRVGINPNGWSKLEYNGQTVYAKSSYLSNAKTDEEGFEPCDEQVTAKMETNLRNAPNTETSEIVYTLKNGEFVRCIGRHPGGWSKLEWNGQTVYALTSYLTGEED